MGFVQYGCMDRLRARCTVGGLRGHFVDDGHCLFLLSFGWCLDVLDWATLMVATGFGTLFGNAEGIGAAAHLGPDIVRIDAGAMPQRDEVVEQIGALANDASRVMFYRLKRHFSGFLDDLLRGLAGARCEQSRRTRMILRRHLGKRPMQTVYLTRLDALRRDAGAGLLQDRCAGAAGKRCCCPLVRDIGLARLTAPARSPDLAGRTSLQIENFEIR